MILTEEQFKALEPYQGHFTKMATAKWSPFPGKSGLELMNRIYFEVTKRRLPLNAGCNHCVTNHIKLLGAIYLADLEERKNQVAAETETPAKKGRGRKSKAKE